MRKLAQALKNKKYLMSDGAMGTSLFERGLQSGDAPELWNETQPQKIQSVYEEYIQAGSDIILTNSFGGNSYRLKLHNAQNKVHELNKKAAQLAQQSIEKCKKQVLVAGSIGPTGEILEPVGELKFEDAVKAFSEQAKGLIEGGADILWIETMSDLKETEAAITACQQFNVDIVATLTFDTNGRTMMGVLPDQAVKFFESHNPHLSAGGLNCGLGASETIASLLKMKQSAKDDTILVCQSNCGVPEYKDGGFTFTGTPELMAEYAILAYACGARIIGGCCGSNGTIMQAIRKSLDSHPQIQKGETLPTPTIDEIIKKLGAIQETSQALHSHAHPHASETQKKRRRH